MWPNHFAITLKINRLKTRGDSLRSLSTMTIDLTYEEVRLLLVRSLAAVDSLRESFRTIESLKSHALHHDLIHAVVVLRHTGLDTFGTDRMEVC